MATFGAICLLLVWIGLVIGIICLFVSCIIDGDPADIFMSGMLLLAVLGLSAFGIVAIEEDNKNPCVAWGPPETTYMWNGKMMVPVTTTPCVKRQNETEK